MVAVIQPDTKNLGRPQQGSLHSDGRHRCKQIQAGLFPLLVDPFPPLRPRGNEGHCVLVSERREGEDMAVLEKCRASGCIATIGDKAHPSIVHRQAKDWVKIYGIMIRPPPAGSSGNTRPTSAARSRQGSRSHWRPLH